MPASAKVAALRKTVHAACRELGYDAEMRRDVQLEVTGKASMKDFGVADFEAMKKALKARGWKPSDGRGKGGAQRRWRSTSPRADIRYIHVLWRLLAEAGVYQPCVAMLNAFINNTRFAAKWGHAQRDVDMLPAEMAQDVIEALKDIAARNGVEIAR